MKKLLLLISFFLSFALAHANQMMVGSPVSGTATTVSTKILNQNSLRAYLIIVNTGSTNNICVKFNASQTGCEGLPIPPGGNYEPFIAPAGSLYLDTASSTSTYVILEGQ